MGDYPVMIFSVLEFGVCAALLNIYYSQTDKLPHSETGDNSQQLIRLLAQSGRAENSSPRSV
jgi:hypothetical protein